MHSIKENINQLNDLELFEYDLGGKKAKEMVENEGAGFP